MSLVPIAIDVAILGASGFGGGELLRLLLAHPNVARIDAISRSHAGKAIAGMHPHLRGLTSDAFKAELDFAAMHSTQNAVVLFAALPHGEFAKLWPELSERLPANATVIDLSADFRLRSSVAFAAAYGYAHPCPEHLPSFVYGLPEANSAHLAGAKRIANPGCFATAIALALLPLVALPYVFGRVHISAVTGSSGSGTQPGAGTHHPTRAHDFRAYKILAHQHESEIQACLAAAARQLGGRAPEFSLVPHSAPMVRGIFATCQFELAELESPGLTPPDALIAAYQQRYQHSRFVNVITESPRAAAVAGSNFCDLSVHVVGSAVAVLCAIDNLGKGMAGQAVQNMNLALGLPEAAGLMAAALFP